MPLEKRVGIAGQLDRSAVVTFEEILVIHRFATFHSPQVSGTVRVGSMQPTQSGRQVAGGRRVQFKPLVKAGRSARDGRYYTGML
jgi:hypothetical protein